MLGKPRSASLAFYLFFPTRLINSIKHWHSCKILYLNTLFSAILASYEVKLLEDIDNCHLRVQLNERNNKYFPFNIEDLI